MDRMARRYGVLPSVALGLTDPWQAVYFDLQCADEGLARDEHVANRAKAWPVYNFGR